MTRIPRAEPRSRYAVPRFPLAVAFLAALLFAAAGHGAAQSAGGAFHVYLVVWRGETDVEHGFRAHMYERGIPVRYTLRNADRNRARLPEFAAEIRAEKPDLVHTFGTSVALGIFGPHTGAEPGMHIGDIPGVFSIVSYPVQDKIVKEFEAPGRPLTGSIFLTPISTQLDTILAYRPIGTLGVIYNPLERNSVTNVDQLRTETGDRDIKLLEYPVPLNAEGRPDATRLDELVDDLVRSGAEFLYMGPDSFITVHSLQVSERAAQQGIPSFAAVEASFERSRAMLGLVSRYYLIGKLAGAQAERILVGGEPPQEIPVASLARFAILLRMPVALQLGIYPPMGLLRVAQVVE
ncbi:MAG: ABC transporter substrate-binding protein [Spirochaetaceae bacterium]|nr:ABC transporter substrate-binding protein [Spirochaetaceae bacterium]MDE0445883.1 ABC transporter substrate-binding protein [Spirochaetaceae bacterium]